MAEIKSLEQKRAKLAWEFVHDQLAKKDKGTQKEFKSAIRKLPTMILTSGLGQTIAFHLAKGKDKPHYEVIKNVVAAIYELTKISDIETPEKLMEKITSTDHETYILLSKETLKYATWLKRFAEAELEG